MSILSHRVEIRVRYNETDGQGRVHHAQYLNYFERGRVELLRHLGHSYRDLELGGLMLVVAEMNVRYLGAALFDDVLDLQTDVLRTRGTRIEHRYRITRTNEIATPDPSTMNPPTKNPSSLIVEATSVIACVNRDGKVQRLPDYLRQLP